MSVSAPPGGPEQPVMLMPTTGLALDEVEPQDLGSPAYLAAVPVRFAYVGDRLADRDHDPQYEPSEVETVGGHIDGSIAP